MAKKVGFKSAYYDIMYILGDHAYEYSETIPYIDGQGKDGDGVTWKHTLWYRVYQFCIVRGMPDNQEMYHTSIHNVDNCRNTVKFYDELEEEDAETKRIDSLSPEEAFSELLNKAEGETICS